MTFDELKQMASEYVAPVLMNHLSLPKVLESIALSHFVGDIKLDPDDEMIIRHQIKHSWEHGVFDVKG